MKRRFEITDGRCVVPHGITDINEREFYCLDELREIVLPETLRGIGREAFKGCWNLEEICIPQGVVEIEDEAFAGCCSLESIEVVEGNPIFRSEGNCCLTKDRKALVFGCKSSVIPASVETIGRSAFQWCETLSGINIPASVVSIQNRAFYGCLALRSIGFADSGNLRKIGADSFSHCPSLRVITLPDGVHEIGPGAFAECRISGLSGFRIQCPVSRKDCSSDARGCRISLFRILSPRSSVTLSVDAIIWKDWRSLHPSPSSARIHSQSAAGEKE